MVSGNFRFSNQKLQQYGLIDSDIKVEEKEIVQYELSPHLREYQKRLQILL